MWLIHPLVDGKGAADCQWYTDQEKSQRNAIPQTTQSQCHQLYLYVLHNV